jgi:hypothetical protein
MRSMRSLHTFLVFFASPVRPRCRLPLPKGGIPWFSCADARGIATPSQPYSGVKALSTIVCMIGNLRGGHAAWDSTVQQLVRPLHADLALVASDADVAHHASIASPLVRAARHIWIYNESTYWDETIDELLEGKGWRGNVSLPVTTNWAAPTGLWGGARDAQGRILRGSGAIVLALRMMLLRRLDALPGDAYEQVVLTRSDFFYACPPGVVHARVDEIHVPEGQDHVNGNHLRGLNDRHAVFAFAARRLALGVLPWLAQGHCRECLGIESALYAYYQSLAPALRICRYSATGFTVARRNESTRWSRGWNVVPLLIRSGVPAIYCKYETEYECAARSCGIQRPDDRCASPGSLAWIRRSDPSAATAHGHGARNASLWTAFLGMGDQPNQVVAFGATRGTAALARHEWLTANRWLPPLNETKNEEGIASARRNRCGWSCRRMLWSHTLANSAVKLLEKERGSEAGSDLRHFTMPKPRRR